MKFFCVYVKISDMLCAYQKFTKSIIFFLRLGYWQDER